MPSESVESVAMLLLKSVTSTVEPLVAMATKSHDLVSASALGHVEALSPEAEKVTGKLLELALSMGLKVSQHLPRKPPVCTNVL